MQDQDKINHYCPECKKIQPTIHRVLESSDGAHLDDKYTCTVCKFVSWIDGIDA